MTEQIQQEEQVIEVVQDLATVEGFVIYTFDNNEQVEQVLLALTEEVLGENTFKPCGKYDQFKSGFTPFTDEGADYLLKVKGSTMFQVTTQVKKPHGATVKKLCKAKELAFMKENDLDKVDKEAKDLIKLSVIESLIPDTVAEDPKTTLVWITEDYLIVGEPSYKKAEEFVATVRDVIGSCPVKPLEVVDVSKKLTTMLKDGYDETLALLNLAHLVNEDTKAVIKFEKERLLDAEVKRHIEDGFVVSKMQMTLDYETDFTINDEFEFSGVRVSKDVLSGSKDIGAMIIVVDEINKVVAECVKVFDVK